MSILGALKGATHLTGQVFAATLHGAVHARTAEAFAGFGRAFGTDPDEFTRAGKDAGRRLADGLAEREASEDVSRRAELVRVVAEALWLHSLSESGTATNTSLDLAPSGAAAAVVDRFACAECGFIDMFEGNPDPGKRGGICNDCAPRVNARAPRCGSRYDSAREGDDTYCLCRKAAGHEGRHVCACDERWTDALHHSTSAAPTPTPEVAAERPDASHPEPGASGQPSLWPDWCPAEIDQVVDILLASDEYLALGYANDLRRAAQAHRSAAAEGNDPYAVQERMTRNDRPTN